MKLNIKQYKHEKIEIQSKEISLPTKTSYYFETHIRRSIRINPIFTTWNKDQHNKDEELYYLEITCIYRSSECWVEKFKIYPEEIEEIYYSDKHKHKSFVKALIDDWFVKRTKEQFEIDLENTIRELQS